MCELIVTVKDIAMKVSTALERVLAKQSIEKASDNEATVIESLKLMKGIADSVLLRKSVTQAEDILVGICYLLIQKPESSERLIEMMRIIALENLLSEGSGRNEKSTSAP